MRDPSIGVTLLARWRLLGEGGALAEGRTRLARLDYLITRLREHVAQLRMAVCGATLTNDDDSNGEDHTA